MTLGEVFLDSITTGVITIDEVDWVTRHQSSFSRAEEAVAIRLGRLIDEGSVNLGCRIPSRLLQHKQVTNDWIEPLGRRRHQLAVA